MRIMTILGTRPEIIRLSLIIPKLDSCCDHILVHTGQNYDKTLYDIFFDEMGLRAPDHLIDSRSDTLMGQVGAILSGCEKLIMEDRPDRVLILGDTNSALSAVVSKRMGIPVYHMEAGNRCFDDRVPEEVNRRVVDHSSDVLMPYTERSRANLLREGIGSDRIYVTGNPINEVLNHYKDNIGNSDILSRLGLAPGKYFLTTLHRAENVDIESRLKQFVEALQMLSDKYGIPVICSLHPRTRSRLESYGVKFDEHRLVPIEPVGLFDFIKLEQEALCVLTDSGTVQEECCIFKVPAVTLRDVTERPETIEAGSNILSGSSPENILLCVNTALAMSRDWNPPAEYLAPDVSSTVVKTVMGYRL